MLRKSFISWGEIMADNAETTPVEQVDSSKKTSEILGPMSEEATVQISKQDEKCYWNDTEFSHGDQVSNNGECYECSYGRWVKVDD